MSYIRQSRVQPDRLDTCASIAWTQAVMSVLAEHKHTFADHACLRLLRAKITVNLLDKLPRVVREQVWREGCGVVRRAVWSAVRDYHQPHSWVPFMYVFYSPDFRSLEIPTLLRSQDRLTVLDLLYNLGTPHGHAAQSLKIKMFETNNISIEESYILKRVLRGFRQLRSLVLWRVCDDAMLQILGVTCHDLLEVDIWKSTAATDAGVRMFLGLDAERPFRVCSSIKRVAIKDTSITDYGAFNLMIHCDNLETLEYSQDSFLQQLLWRISQNYSLTKTVFRLRSLFLTVNKPSMLVNLVRSLPRLEELTIWSALRHVEDIEPEDLGNLASLKLAGLEHYSFLADTLSVAGERLTKLCLESIQFDVDPVLVGGQCPNLAQLSVINARVSLGRQQRGERARDPEPLFPRLTQLYLYLVQYLPAIDMHTRSVTTGLHLLLAQAPGLTSVQCPGTSLLTDKDLLAILDTGALARLTKLVITQPISVDHRTVPLSQHSVIALHKACPGLSLLGDLKHWDLSPPLRRKLIKRYNTCNIALPVAVGQFF